MRAYLLWYTYNVGEVASPSLIMTEPSTTLYVDGFV
jgi:hypothetical protein